MGRKKLEELTAMDIRNFKRDIENYKAKQRTFLILGFVFLVLFLVGLVATIFLGFGVYRELREGDMQTAYFLFLLFDTIVGGLTLIFMFVFILMFVLRGALFNSKIDNRRRLIEDYEDMQKDGFVKEKEPKQIEEKKEEKVVQEEPIDIEEIK